MSDRSKRNDSTPGLHTIKRDATGAVMRALTRFTGSDIAQKYGLSDKIDRVAYESTKGGMRTLGAINRQFKKSKGSGKPVRLEAQGSEGDASTEPKKPAKVVFDLTPTEDQEMLVSAVREFAEEQLRPSPTRPAKLPVPRRSSTTPPSSVSPW